MLFKDRERRRKQAGPLCPGEPSASQAGACPKPEWRRTRQPGHVPLGGRGHSGGHVADHRVIHVRQRARRAAREDSYMILIITDVTGGRSQWESGQGERTDYHS